MVGAGPPETRFCNFLASIMAFRISFPGVHQELVGKIHRDAILILICRIQIASIFNQRFFFKNADLRDHVWLSSRR